MYNHIKGFLTLESVICSNCCTGKPQGQELIESELEELGEVFFCDKCGKLI